MEPRTRRRFLRGIATTSIAAVVAGCTGGDADDDGNVSSPTPSPDPTSTPENGTSGESREEEATPENEETPEDPEAFDDPEEAARSVVALLDGGEYESATERFDPAVTAYAPPALLERVWLGLTAIGGEYEAVVDAETTQEEGRDTVYLSLSFERGTYEIRSQVTDDGTLWTLAVDGEYESPAYVDPTAFTEREVDLDVDGCHMGATVTIPEGEESVPGVVLVHGSGPVDRDVTAGPNAMFRDLAEGLSSQGIAVLRYDKRSFACNVDIEDQTLDGLTVDDAVVALDRLRDVDEVDAERVVLVGHSLGGMAAPRIAERDGEVAGIVGLAAPARPLHELFIDQYAYFLEIGELTGDFEQQEYDAVENQYDQIVEDEYADDEDLLNAPGAFWDSIREYDPVATATDLDVPQAYLQGERDYQVTPEGDYETWRDALGEDGATFELYPEYNHLFMPGEGPPIPEEQAVPNNVAGEVVDDVAALVVEWTGQ